MPVALAACSSNHSPQSQIAPAPVDRDAALARTTALNDKAMGLLQAGDAPGSLALFSEALRVRRELLGEHDALTLSSLHNQALALEAIGQFKEAEALFSEALQHRRELLGETHPETLDSLNGYAAILNKLGRAAVAEPLVLKALHLRTVTLGERHPNTLESLSDNATVLESLGRLQEAEAGHAEALRLRREVLGEDHPDTLESLGDHASMLAGLGRATEAEPLFANALERSRAMLGERHPATLSRLHQYALNVRRDGRATEAEPLAAQALALRREILGELHPDTLNSLGSYAGTLSAQGRKADALELFGDALRLRREVLGERHPQTLISLNNYATELRSLGRTAEAEPLFAEALRLRSETLGDRHPQTLSSLNNHAFALLGLGRLADAEPLLEKALRVRREVLGERHPETLNSLNNYAFILRRLGRAAEAEPLFAETLKLRRDTLGERHPDTLQSLNNYANVQRQLGFVSEAENLFAEALQLYREVLGDRHPVTLRSLTNYAVHLFDTGEKSKALPRYRELVAATRERAAQLAESGLSGDVQRDRELADRQAKEKLFADILWANAAGDPASKAALSAEAFIALQIASAGSTSKAVAEAAALRFASGEGLKVLVQERQALGRQWINIEAELVRNQTGGEETSENRRLLGMQLAQFDERITAIDERLRAEVPQFFAILNQNPASLEQTRSILDPEEAVLFLVPSDFGTHALAVTRERMEWAQSQRSAEQIGQDVAAMREGLEVKDEFLPMFDLDLAHTLYHELVAPVESALAGKTRVYVVAGGALSRLPLGTLLTDRPPEGAEADNPAVLREAPWLADRYALVQIPSLQSLIYIRSFGVADQQDETNMFRGFGNPVLDGVSVLRGARSATYLAADAATLRSEQEGGVAGTFLMDPAALRQLAQLPGTASELQQVRVALNAPENALYLGEAMTETAIRNADLSQTSIVHLATHGLTSEESGTLVEPGLVFTPPDKAGPLDDGYLAASEIVGIDLTAAQWVILSACNTASNSANAGETGLSGLAQAFFYAGAESLLVTHWPVFDDIAPLLTVRALKLSQGGMSRAEALQAAMFEIRMQPDYDAAHPAVWAPFALVGEGR